VTFVRTDLLRTKWWESAVSLAGPAMNLLLFLVGAALLHPRFGPMAPSPFQEDWTPAQMVVASLTMLQLFSVLLNLIPLPPLDGFGALHPLLPRRTQATLNNPSTRTVMTVVLFVVIFSGGLFRPILGLVTHGLALTGYDATSAANVERVTKHVVFGQG
jgi:Zn-dependent protease